MILEHIVFDWRDALDITLVGVLLYQVIQLLRGTRALAVLSGLGVLTALYFMSRSMGLYTLSWLLQQTVDLAKNQAATLQIQGRHDPCILHRAAIVQTAATAFGLLDLLTQNGGGQRQAGR